MKSFRRRFIRPLRVKRFRNNIMKSRLLANRNYRFSMKARRRRAKPELKFYSRQVDADIPANTRTLGTLTPINILQGPGQGNRIGQEIKSFKIAWNLSLVNSNAIAGEVNWGPTYLIRIIAWTPRVNFADANLYFETINFNEMIDYNVATILLDRYVSMGTQGSNAAGSEILSPAVPTQRHFKFVFKHPRSMKFSPGINTLDEEKYGVFFCIMMNNGLTETQLRSYTRMTYIDT